MYGSVARLQIKAGMEAHLLEFDRQSQAVMSPGFICNIIYRMDADPTTYYLVVVFASKEAYVANSTSPGQEARYRKLRVMLERDPEWNDGEVVSSFLQL